MTKSSPLFDLAKLNNIAKNYLSSLSAEAVYTGLASWAQQFDDDFFLLIDKERNYTIKILNIERQRSKPRKDFACFSEIKTSISYMYDEFFAQEQADEVEIKDFYLASALEDYINNIYDEKDSEELWFSKIKELCPKYGFAATTKDYKANPEKYQGSVADFCEVLRVAVSHRTLSPNLYEVFQVLGLKRVKQRIIEFAHYCH